MRSSIILLSATAAVVAIGSSTVLLAPVAQSQTRAAAPARYEMDAGTISGFGGMGQASMMSVLTGRAGRGEAQKELHLRLGSQQSASGAPQADHFMPEGARLGRSVPLITPQRAPETNEMPGDRPRGRLLIFWGCGAHAGPGQPVVIDFSRIAAGQMPPNLFSASAPRDREVSFSNSRTYGDWPNSRSRANVTPQASLLGLHRVAATYAPEITFTLAQDFMPALSASSARQADDSTQISWPGIAGATGYYAWTMGFRGEPGSGNGDMVWWSSSASQQFGGALWDWISPSTVATLIRQRVVMPPTQTNCTVPAEVKRAAPDMMFGTLYAYGPQADFAYPPRPANARTAWTPEWTARVRYRSMTSWMDGMPGMDGADTAASNGSNNGDQNRRCRRRGGLGGAIGGALGLPNC